MTVDTSTSVSGATITANGSGGTYQWLDCDNGSAVIPAATGQSFTPSANGNYAVVVTQGFCTDTSGCVNIQSVAVAETNEANVSVYPNPFSGIFTITNCPLSAVVTITDAQGKLVLSSTGSSSRVAVDLTSEPSGVYFVEIRAGESVIRKRAVKL
jgi:hypothetical protein